MRDKHRILILSLVLAGVVLGVFWQVRGFEFLNYDDNIYVNENEHISTGFNFRNVGWVFSSEHGNNWHPVTGLSHILDCELFGLNPGSHHLVNVLFHVIGTILVFIVFRNLTGSFWISAFLAAVFGLHPAHVESVAWISERKDVLSGVFWFLTMAAYLNYIRKPKLARYILTVVVFSLGLMSKPMLVTLPFVLLLLDYWPLERFGKGKLKNLILEKIPLFILSAVSCVVTVIVQSQSGALKNMEQFRLPARFGNAAVSYVRYICKMFWPADLAIFYPHYGDKIASWQIGGSILLLLAITFFVIRNSGRYKYLLTGWLWYLGTLVPVIGIVQVGEQSMADRYTYVPYIGLSIVIGWGLNDLFWNWKHRKVVLCLTSVAAVLVLAVCSYIQTSYWRDSITLFSRAIEVTSGNYVAYTNRGNAWSQDKKRYDLAVADYSKAIEIKPGYAEAFSNRGNVYKSQGEYALAMFDYNRAIEINPGLAQAYNNRATVYCEKGEFAAAILDCDKAIKINPRFSEAYNNRANAYARGLGKFDLAIADYGRALEINPKYYEAYSNRGNTYKRLGQFDLAIADYGRSIELNPRYAEAYVNRGNAYAQNMGRFDVAVADYDKAIELDSKLVGTYLNKAIACESAGWKKEAIEAYKAFIENAPIQQANLVEQVRQKIKELER